MLDINNAIRVEYVKYKNCPNVGKKYYIFKCINCENEMKKSQYECAAATGLCKKCNKGSTKEFKELTEKNCSKCHRVKPISEFKRRKDGAGHYRAECNHCRIILLNFDINSADYDKMLDSQNGECAICQKTHSHKRKDGTEIKLAIDHCHETGAIRGLLCSSCNQGLGMFKDSPELLNKAIEYINNKKDNK